MKKIILDEKICAKHKLTLSEALLALTVRSIKDTDIHNMLNREILVIKNGQYLVTQHWSEELDEILCDSPNDCERTDDEILALAKKLREIYPEGKMKDKYGTITPYYYRCNNSEVAKALKRFFTQKGNYSDEEIINATKRYVASFQGMYWQRNMRLLKYFIIKNPIKQGEDGRGYVEQISDLETYLSNGGSEGEEVANTSDDWLMNPKN